jgi:hypothetical protein
MRKLIAVAGLGAGLTYFFDPDNGARRRTEARERVLTFFRRRLGQIRGTQAPVEQGS